MTRTLNIISARVALEHSIFPAKFIRSFWMNSHNRVRTIKDVKRVFEELGARNFTPICWAGIDTKEQADIMYDTLIFSVVMSYDTALKSLGMDEQDCDTEEKLFNFMKNTEKSVTKIIKHRKAPFGCQYSTKPIAS